MATILWGHGERDRADEKTFVPDGRTVKWYSEVDRDQSSTSPREVLSARASLRFPEFLHTGALVETMLNEFSDKKVAFE